MCVCVWRWTVMPYTCDILLNCTTFQNLKLYPRWLLLSLILTTNVSEELREKRQNDYRKQTKKREVRLQERRETYRRRRYSETQEQAEHRRLSRKNSDRSKETPEQRAERLQSKRSNTQQQRANETSQQRQRRLSAQRLYYQSHSDFGNTDPITNFHAFLSNTNLSNCHQCHELILPQFAADSPTRCGPCEKQSFPLVYSHENNVHISSRRLARP